jgi:hypothetical protein
LSEGEVEKRLSDQNIELNFVVEWQDEATEEENGMVNLVDLPTDKDKEVQPRRLHKESQPLDQLDEVIEGIRRLMLRSSIETTSEEEISRGEPAIAAGQEMQQQQRRSGADGQLQSTV